MKCPQLRHALAVVGQTVAANELCHSLFTQRLSVQCQGYAGVRLEEVAAAD